MSLRDLAFIAAVNMLEFRASRARHLKTNASAPLEWNRKGMERLDKEEDDSVLSGWYGVISWFLHFALSAPRDALFLRKFSSGVDTIDIMDRYFQYEPTMFVMYTTGVVYSMLGIIGSVLYVQLRRAKRCGGERTQDLSENLRCILHVYTVSYVAILVAILMGSLLMIAALFEVSRTFGDDDVGFRGRMSEVTMYIKNASLNTQHLNEERKKVFDDLSRAMSVDFEKEMYNFMLPMIEEYTTNAQEIAKFIPPSAFQEAAPVSENRAPRMKKQTPNDEKAQVQKNITKLIVLRIHSAYNDTIVEAGKLAAKASTMIKQFNGFLRSDTALTVKSFLAIPERFSAADTWNVIKTLRSRSTFYIGTVLFTFTLLFSLYAGSFIAGIFNYNELIPPTKRTNYSNFAGVAMVAAIVLSFPICSVLMLVTNFVMVMALTLTNYVCRPYDNIVFGTKDIEQVTLLDDTQTVLWPEESRGKWFGKFLAGTTLMKCNGGRLFDIVRNDFADSINGFIKKTENLRHLLISLTVDPYMILLKDPIHKPAKYFDSMRQLLWDKLDNVMETFSSERTKAIREKDQDEDVVNPPCFSAYQGYEKALRFVCHGMVRNMNAFWTALGFCTWMFTILGILAHNFSKYFLRMVNYTYDGSEVESTSTTSITSAEAAERSTSTGEKVPEGDAKGGLKKTPSDEKSKKGEADVNVPKWLQKVARRKSITSVEAVVQEATSAA